MSERQFELNFIIQRFRVMDPMTHERTVSDASRAIMAGN